MPDDVDGFDLECTTIVRAADRERLEALCKYVLRPPLADRRLRVLDTGEVGIELKRPWSDGTSWVTMSPDAFLERLYSLVPREREHTILYRCTPEVADTALLARVRDESGPRTTYCH